MQTAVEKNNPRFVSEPEKKEYTTLNLGPTHPATHGIFQNVLKMDGEIIVEAEPHHRIHSPGLRKISRAQTLLSDYSYYRPTQLLFVSHQQHGLAHDG
jgi:NADH:ubiquinone oxidoreductase subunit D